MHLLALRSEQHLLELSRFARLLLLLDISKLLLSLVVLWVLTSIHLLVALPNLRRQWLQSTGSLSLGSIVHQRFHGLFALKTAWLELVKGCVHDLAVHALELSILIQVDFNVLTLRQKLSNQGENVVQ